MSFKIKRWGEKYLQAKRGIIVGFILFIFIGLINSVNLIKYGYISFSNKSAEEIGWVTEFPETKWMGLWAIVSFNKILIVGVVSISSSSSKYAAIEEITIKITIKIY